MKKNLQSAYLIGPVLIFLSLLFLVFAIDKDNVNTLYQQEERLEEAIRKSAISCYAQEGAYPNDLAYLEENYGLILNKDKYFYYYDLFASNILPDIEVKAKANTVGR